MTRLAILSDIHGNLPALQAVIADMAQFEVDQVIVAGDSINCGPFSEQVLDCIINNNWSVMRGNHEFYMLYYNTPFEPPHWADFESPRWLNEHIPKYWRNIIAGLPDELRLCFPDAPFLRVVHGSPGARHWNGIYPNQTSDDDLRKMLAGVEETTIVSAHTHLRMERRVDQWHIINPGSVGQPLDGILGARYMILDGNADGWTPTFRHLQYDLTPLFDACERADYLGRLGTIGRLWMEEFRTARPWIHGYRQWWHKYRSKSADTMALVDEFFTLDDVWEFRMPDYHINLDL